MKAFLDEEERMLEEIRPGDLGNAGLVEERKIGDKEMIFVENCQKPKSDTFPKILLISYLSTSIYAN